MFIFGGSTNTGLVSDVWQLSNANGIGGTPAWTQLSPTGGPPAARTQHTATYQTSTGRMTIFAGWDNNNALNDTWVFGTVIQVQIDITPGAFPNTINLSSGGFVPVAVLTTPTFDAATVAVSTVLFAGATPVRSSLVDVDADGDLDLLVQFAARSLNLTCASTQATLTGNTGAGTPIRGTDSVRIIRDRNNVRCR